MKKKTEVHILIDTHRQYSPSNGGDTTHRPIKVAKKKNYNKFKKRIFLARVRRVTVLHATNVNRYLAYDLNE